MLIGLVAFPRPPLTPIIQTKITRRDQKKEKL
jgi:hypothetical protein